MAVPADLFEQFSSRLIPDADPGMAPGLSLGVPSIDAVLPDGGIPRGVVVEFAVHGSASLATSLALAVCRAAQQEGLQRYGQAPWCSFVDPSETLYGPGVLQAGVQLERLLVVRPRVDTLSRVTLRLAESRAFSVVVVDTAGTPGAPLNISLGSWPRIVRRLAIAATESKSILLLITDGEARRPLPLPVAMRLELERPNLHQLSLRITKDKRGRISVPRSVAWTRPRPKTIQQQSARFG